MIFDGITLHNYGVYLGSQHIGLRPTNPKKPIILFGGLNGVGKTTLLDAFQLGLFGKLASPSNRGGLAYDKYLKKCVHKSVPISEGAAITINFRHQLNGSEHTYQVTRSWRQNKKSFTENIEVLCDGKTDMVLTESWAEIVEQFIPNRISNLFFFDGEKIKDLADFKKSSELIATGINQLLGLDIVDRLMTDLVVLEKKKAQALADRHEQKKIRFLEDKALELNKKREQLSQKLSAAQEVIEKIDGEIRELNEKFRMEGGDLYRERGELEARRAETKSLTEETHQKLLDAASSELPLALVEPLLECVLRQAADEEIAEKDEKICGAILEHDKKIVSYLKSRKAQKDLILGLEAFLREDAECRVSAHSADKYLGVDAETTQEIVALIQGGLVQTATDTHKLLDEQKNHQIDLENLERKLALVPDADAIRGIIEQKDALDRKRFEAQVSAELIEEELRETQKMVLATTNELSKEYEKKLETENKRDAAQRVLVHSKKSRATLEAFKKRVVAHHLSRIQRNVLDSFKKLLRKEVLVTDIRIDPQTYQISVIGSDKKVVDLDRLSAGEKQLLSVSLLWGLAQTSGRSLPAIIDTPLGRLDTTHRTHLIERYFPQASHQVLLLSTDEEINEKYYRMIEPYVSQAYRLEFDESKQTTTITPGYFW